MKRKIFMLFFAIISSTVSANVSPTDVEYQARKLAEELVDGKDLVVRVYSTGENPSTEYETARVQLRGLSFSHKDIKQIVRDIDESHIIVVLGADQANNAIAAVLDKYVSLNNYGANKVQSIRPEMSRADNNKYLVFCDALGNPIPNAKIDVKINLTPMRGRGINKVSEASLITEALDSEGRYKLPVWTNANAGLVYVLSHPNYGKAIVQSGGINNQNIVFILPLVPSDSEAASRSFRGVVVDDNGEPVTSLPISLSIMNNNNEFKQYSKTNGIAITDDNGLFSIYTPLEQNGELYTGIAPETMQYHLIIRPPTSSNLLSYDSMTNSRGGFQAGSEPKKIILRRLNPDLYFHTFTFVDERGIIEDPEQLSKISITVSRDNRVWQSLKYDQFKDGCYLNLGKLRATAMRWNKQLTFPEIELTEESPEEIVLTTGQEKIYSGMVIDAITGKPVPDILVLAESGPRKDEDYAKLKLQANELQLRTKNESEKGLSDEQLYETKMRVVLTDRQGRYQFVFRRGLGNDLEYFTAIDENYYAKRVHLFEIEQPKDESVFNIKTIELLPPQAQYPPVLVFEDDKGNVITDPNIYENIWINIKSSDGSGSGCAYKNLPPWQINGFTYGIYTATLDYGEHHYVYEPVTINLDSPHEILFKLKEKQDMLITVRGRVVNGITDEPMAGVVVYSYDSWSIPVNSYGQSGYVNIINSFGDNIDFESPDMEKLAVALNAATLVLTDKDGRYELPVERQSVSLRPMSSITAVKKNYMSARQNIHSIVSENKNSNEQGRTVTIDSNADNTNYVPDMVMFPSGNITFELNLPDMTIDGQQRTRVIFQFVTSPQDTTPWIKKLREMNANIVRPSELQPNGKQTFSLPAGVEMTLIMYTLNNQSGGVTLPGIKLEQGQTLDLGLIEFPETYKVYAKVIDSQDRPVQGVAVSCIDEFGRYRGQQMKTNSDGIASLYVTPNSRGQFVVACQDQQTKETLREVVFYEVKGIEDAGKEFLLQLPDEIVDNLLNNNQ